MKIVLPKIHLQRKCIEKAKGDKEKIFASHMYHNEKKEIVFRIQRILILINKKFNNAI